MTTAVTTEKPELELSCREAHLILRVIPLRKNVSDMKKEEITSINHYLYCKACRDMGLADILDTKLSHQEAILVWAEQAEALWLYCGLSPRPSFEALIELYATEHVWGKYQLENSMGGHGWDQSIGCGYRACLELHYYWADVPMSSHSDGPSGVIRLFPSLFEIFLKEKWPLDALLAVQKKRISAVLKDIKSGKVSSGHGHYNLTDELIEEMEAHVVTLQKLVMRSKTQVVSK